MLDNARDECAGYTYTLRLGQAMSKMGRVALSSMSVAFLGRHDQQGACESDCSLGRQATRQSTKGGQTRQSGVLELRHKGIEFVYLDDQETPLIQTWGRQPLEMPLGYLGAETASHSQWTAPLLTMSANCFQVQFRDTVVEGEEEVRRCLMHFINRVIQNRSVKC